MSLFVISDLHLSLGCDKKMDVFEGWKDYVTLIEKNWKRTVNKDDTVIVCGDISWGMNLEESFEDFKFLNSLPGEKILLKGNHDFWWISIKKVKDFFKENNFNTLKLMRNNSFEREGYCLCGTRGWTTKDMNEHDLKMVKREIGRLKLSFDSCKSSKLEKIVFLHYPPVYFGVESEILNFLSKNHIKKCYYGHVHLDNSPKYTKTSIISDVECNLVSCDYLKFTPKMII